MAMIAEPMLARDLQVGDRFVDDNGNLWNVIVKEDSVWVWMRWNQYGATGLSGSAEVWRLS